MATYFHGNPAELQAPDGLQTLILMNPTTYVQQQQFSDTTAPAQQPQQPHNNLIFLNSSSLSPHAPPPSHPQHFVGIPTTTNHQDDTISPLHGLLPRVHYNLYSPSYPSPPERDTPRAKQGLSLSLSSQHQPGFAVSGEAIRVSGGSASSGSGVTNGVSGMHSVLLSSKYLKVVQELLDEVVSVNNSGKFEKFKIKVVHFRLSSVVTMMSIFSSFDAGSYGQKLKFWKQIKENQHVNDTDTMTMMMKKKMINEGSSRSRSTSTLPQQTMTRRSQPRFAPELDGVHCFETIIPS